MKSLLRHLSRARCKKGRPEKRFSIPGTKCPSISRTNHSRNLHRGVALYFQKHSKDDIFQNNKNFKMNLSPVSFSYIWCWAITIRTILLLIIGVQLSLYYFPFLSDILKACHLSFFVNVREVLFLDALIFTYEVCYWFVTPLEFANTLPLVLWISEIGLDWLGGEVDLFLTANSVPNFWQRALLCTTILILDLSKLFFLSILYFHTFSSSLLYVSPLSECF